MRLRRELSDPGDALRSWRDQKHDILRQAEVRRSLIVAEDESSDSEGEGEGEGRSSGVRRTGSVGSLGRRRRHSHKRQSREDLGDLATPSPYLHTGLRSMSADINSPPPPPPRDPKLRHLMSAMRGRPVSYSFEHLRSVAGDRPRPGHDIPPPPPSHAQHHQRHKSQPPPRLQPSRATVAHLPPPGDHHQLPLPPRRPGSSSQSSDLGITQHSTPVHNERPESTLNNVVADHVPRSRRPLHYQALSPGSRDHSQPKRGQSLGQVISLDQSEASSEGIGSQTSLEDGCEQQTVSAMLPSVPSVPSVTSRVSDHTLTASSAQSRLLSGKCSPASVSSKDSGWSASSDVLLTLSANQRPGLVTMVAAPGSPGSGQQSGADVAGFSTRKRRSRFEEAIRELELVYNNIAEDEV